MEKKNFKMPASPEKLYKILMIITFSVASVFFLKNVFSKNVQAIVTIGIVLFVFAGAVFLMTKFNVDAKKKQLTMGIGLDMVAFLISINSGDFYSDDFILLIAILALTGMFLEPLFAIVQGILGAVLLMVLYAINPGKADPLSQYIMCVALYLVASLALYLLIKRGRAYIELGNTRAEQAENLLKAIQDAGEKLENHFEKSSERITGMNAVNDELNDNVVKLQQGSDSVSFGTKDVGQACTDAMYQVNTTQEHIETLNATVKNVEEAMEENSANMHVMTEQMKKVGEDVSSVTTVFADLQKQINEISGVTNQLTKIAISTKMLALNAAIEAAKAGTAGDGFSVVALKVQELSVDSNSCSEQVVHIVEQMKEKISKTAEELQNSVIAIEDSHETLRGLEEGTAGLTTQFGSLFGNIEEQNKNIKEVDNIFTTLKHRVNEMGNYAEENRNMVDSIVSATDMYREYVDNIIEDTKKIHDLSADMLETTADFAN